MSKEKKRSHHKKLEPAPHRRKAKQRSLPGMENRGILELEEAAEAYMDNRDKRQRLLKDEVALKGNLRFLMQKHDKLVYRHDGVEIIRSPMDDGIKVKSIDVDSQTLEEGGKVPAKKKSKKKDRSAPAPELEADEEAVAAATQESDQPAV